MKEENQCLDDEQGLKDSPPPRKLPWIIAAITIVLFVLGAQFFTRFFLQKLTQKDEATMIIAEEKEEKTLKLPKFNEVLRPRSAPPKLKSSTEEELARLRLMVQMEERKKALEEQEAMIQSPALVNIGVRNTEAKRASRQLKISEGSQDSNVAYLKSISNQAVAEVNAGRFGDLRFRIRKGKILRGVTESAIDSDLPGMIRGHVTEDIYGDQGDLVLIPNGSGLIGEYRSGAMKNGQVRLYVVWTRLQLANGIFVALDSSGSDALGRAGMTGPVNHHYMERYGASLLTSIVSAGAASWGVDAEDRYNSMAAYRQGLSSSLAETASQELEQNRQIQNTISPPQGTEISVLVNKDISFEEVLSEEEGAP